MPTVDEIPYKIASIALTNVEMILFLSFVIPLIVFTIVSNSLVVHVIKNFPPLKTPSNQLLLSLALTDLLSAWLVMPVSCYYSVIGKWNFGVLGCQAWLFSSSFLCGSSILHLCAIAIDRCKAITEPLRYGLGRSNKKFLNIVCLVWTSSFLMVCPQFVLPWGTKWPEEFHDDTPCTVPQDPAYAIYGAVTMFIIPVVILIVTYIKLFQVNRARYRKKIVRASRQIELKQMAMHKMRSKTNLKNRNANSEHEPQDLIVAVDEVNNKTVTKCVVKGSKRRLFLPNLKVDLNRKKNGPMFRLKCRQCQGSITRVSVHGACQVCSVPNNLVMAAEKARLAILIYQEKRSMLTIFVIVCIFIVCWAPGYTIYVLMTLFPDTKVSPLIITCAVWLCYLNSACNPIVYTIFNEDFRKAFIHVFRINSPFT